MTFLAGRKEQNLNNILRNEAKQEFLQNSSDLGWVFKADNR
jgi:hypothetical protein